MAVELVQRPEGVALAVKVMPGASRDRIAGEYAGGLKITVSKAPQAGAANQAVLQLLAGVLRIPVNNLAIVRGLTSPRKQVLIRGMTMEMIRERIDDSG